jgi:pimeloyl-ACP methyl ester carboxylesterase
MGGLLAQKAAAEGLACAAVLIASAPPRGILVAGPRLLVRQIRYLQPMLRSRPLVPGEQEALDLVFNRTPPEQRVEDFARLVPESGRAGIELSLGLSATRVDAQRVQCPVLVVTGRDDAFVVPRVARQIARRYAAPLREYEGLAHHIIIEPGWERPANDIIHWLDHVARRT